MRVHLHLKGRLGGAGGTSILYLALMSMKGQSVPEHVSRGFWYADGVFETMVYLPNHRYPKGWWQYHLDRLVAGLGMLQLNLPEEWSTIFSSELSLLGWLHTFTGLHADSIRIKVGVARTYGGLYTPESQQAEVFVETSAYVSPATTVSLAGISQQVVLVGNAYSKLKTLSALPYVVAAQERQRNNWPEILLPNADGLLVEAGSANLFWHLNGQWYTTHEGSGAVLGTMQPRLSAWLAAQGFHVSRASGLPKQSLADLDHLLLTNAAGIRVLGTVKGTSKLYTAPEWLAEAINHCAPHQVKGTV